VWPGPEEAARELAGAPWAARGKLLLHVQDAPRRRPAFLEATSTRNSRAVLRVCLCAAIEIRVELRHEALGRKTAVLHFGDDSLTTCGSKHSRWFLHGERGLE